MKKIFTETLPTKDGMGVNKGKKVIDWNNSVGCKVKFIYEDIEGEIEIVDYKDYFLYLKYLDSDIYKLSTGNFMLNQIGWLLNKYNCSYQLNIGDIIKTDKLDITIIDCKKELEKKYYRKYYKYKCNKCGYEGWRNEARLLNPQNESCSCCCNRVAVLGINTIWDTDRWMCDLGVSEEDAKKYTKASGAKIEVTCPDCGKKNKILIYNLYVRKSIRCSCGDKKSYVSKYMHSLLMSLEVNFDTEVIFDWCKFYNTFKNRDSKGVYDFVVENLKLIIETDGEFHRTDNKINGLTLKEAKFIDSEKDRLAIENGYKIIRISNEGNIRENILNSELNSLFDLSNVNWNKCEEYALSNTIKYACELKKNNPDLTSKEIGEIIKVAQGNVIKYLKKGTELGWCNYDAKEESKKGSRKAIKIAREKAQESNSKTIEIFKNGESLGIYKSASELKRQYSKLYGINFSSGSISEVCKGKRKHHKGFTFRYVYECD